MQLKGNGLNPLPFFRGFSHNEKTDSRERSESELKALPFFRGFSPKKIAYFCLDYR